MSESIDDLHCSAFDTCSCVALAVTLARLFLHSFSIRFGVLDEYCCIRFPCANIHTPIRTHLHFRSRQFSQTNPMVTNLTSLNWLSFQFQPLHSAIGNKTFCIWRARWLFVGQCKEFENRYKIKKQQVLEQKLRQTSEFVYIVDGNKRVWKSRRKISNKRIGKRFVPPQKAIMSSNGFFSSSFFTRIFLLSVSRNIHWLFFFLVIIFKSKFRCAYATSVLLPLPYAFEIVKLVCCTSFLFGYLPRIYSLFTILLFL